MAYQAQKFSELNDGDEFSTVNGSDTAVVISNQRYFKVDSGHLVRVSIPSGATVLTTPTIEFGPSDPNVQRIARS